LRYVLDGCTRDVTERATHKGRFGPLALAARERAIEGGRIRRQDGKRVTPQGEPISVEFLLDEPSSQPHHMLFIKNLETLGIEATLRIVDAVQYRKRVDDFDFDLTVQRFGFSSTPGDSLRSFFPRRPPRSGARRISPAYPIRSRAVGLPQKQNAFAVCAAFRIERLEASLDHAREIAFQEELEAVGLRHRGTTFATIALSVVVISLAFIPGRLTVL
jgi:hypothetical protein